MEQSIKGIVTADTIIKAMTKGEEGLKELFHREPGIRIGTVQEALDKFGQTIDQTLKNLDSLRMYLQATQFFENKYGKDKLSFPQYKPRSQSVSNEFSVKQIQHPVSMALPKTIQGSNDRRASGNRTPSPEKRRSIPIQNEDFFLQLVNRIAAQQGKEFLTTVTSLEEIDRIPDVNLSKVRCYKFGDQGLTGIVDELKRILGEYNIIISSNVEKAELGIAQSENLNSKGIQKILWLQKENGSRIDNASKDCLEQLEKLDTLSLSEKLRLMNLHNRTINRSTSEYGIYNSRQY